MKHTITALTTVALMAGLTACTSNDGDTTATTSSSATTTSTSVTVSTTATSTTSSTSTSQDMPAPEPVAEAPPEPAVAPAPVEQPAPAPAPVVAELTVVQCLEGTPGPTLMSDGTTQYTDHCFYANGGPEYLEAENQAGLVDPNSIPYADGGTCPAYLCGYGTDENGNPRPNNTEIQSWWGECIAVNSTEYCRENDPYQQ